MQLLPACEEGLKKAPIGVADASVSVERERDIYIYIYIYVYVCTHTFTKKKTVCIYIYIYIYMCYPSPLMYPRFVIELCGIVVASLQTFPISKYTEVLICSSVPAPSVVLLLHLPIMLFP